MKNRTITLEHVADSLGLREKFAAEDEAKRAARHAELRKRVKDAEAAYARDNPAAQAAVAAVNDERESLNKALAALDQKWLNARGAADAVYDRLVGVKEPADREMLTCYDPKIDDLFDQLEQLRLGTPGLFRSFSDPDGPYKDPNGRSFSDNRDKIHARLVGINDARDAANRLKVDPNIDDLPAAIAAILASIPKA